MNVIRFVWPILIASAISSRAAASETAPARPAPQQPAATEKAPVPKMSCGSITDRLCDDLWSKENRGNMSVPDGQVLAGRSKKSEMAQRKILDLNAIVESEPRLPDDLRTALRPHLQQLKSLLAEERDSKSWYRDIALQETKINNAILDVASARTENAHPSFKDVMEGDRTFEQRAFYAADEFKVRDEMLEAKYASHPNWLRVQNTFTKVQADLLAAVDSLNAPEETKQAMREKIRTVKLVLPYTDHAKLGAVEECGRTVVNASYYPSQHKFTMCAGWFNTYQTEANLYWVIAHEISHSVDSNQRAGHQCHLHSPVSKALQPLAHSSKPAYSCTDWEKIKTKLASPKSAAQDPRKVSPATFPDPLQALYDCLAPKDKLEKQTPAALASAAQASARRQISAYASDNSFLLLAQPTVNKDGKTVENEFYMRPDRLIARDNGYGDTTGRKRDPDLYEIFSQNLACVSIQRNGKTITYKDATKESRHELFEKAILATRAIEQARTLDGYQYCGTNCPDLQDRGLSSSSGENLADWLAFRAFSFDLARKGSVEERREPKQERAENRPRSSIARRRKPGRSQAASKTKPPPGSCVGLTTTAAVN